MGNALLLQRKYERVRDDIKPAAESSEVNVARILEIQGRAQLGLGKVKAACGLFEEAVQKDAANVKARWGLAICDAGLRKPDSARARLNEAIKLEPKNPYTWSRLGDLERGVDKREAAVQAYNKSLEFWPQYLDAILGRASIRLMEKNWKEAEEDINRVLTLSRNYYVAVHLKGVLAYGLERYQDAKTIFELVLKSSPDYEPAILWLGFTEFALGNNETSASYLARYLQNNPFAVRVHALYALVQARQGRKPETERLLKALRNASLEDPKSLMVMGQAYALLNEGDLALQQLQRAIDIEPDEAETRLNLALTLVQQGKTADAIEQLEKTLKIRPDSRPVQELLIQTLIREKRLDDALKEVDAFEKKFPKSPAPPTYRGHILLAKDPKNPEPAKKEFQRALKLDPAYLTAAHNLAAVLLSEGKAEDARQQYRGVLRTRPGDLTTLLALHALELKEKRPGEARQYLTTAVERNPTQAAPAALLGQIHIKEGRALKALEVTGTAAKANPGDATLVQIRAAAYGLAGDAKNSLAGYKRLAQLKPDSTEIQLQVALLHSSQNDIPAYRESLRSVLALQPDHLRAKSLLARLELGQGRPAEAVRIARELQKQHPKAAEGYVLESDALRAQGDNARSVKVLEDYQGQNAAELGPRVLLMTKYLQVGEKDKALKLARETEAAMPGRPEVLDVHAQTQLGAGDYKGAVQTYQRLIQLNPKSAGAYIKLARAHESARNAEGVRAALGKAIELQPDYLEAQFALATAEIRARRYPEALKLAKQIQTQRPGESSGHVVEGDVWVAQKDYAKAARAYEAGYKAQPGGQVAMKLHFALERTGSYLDGEARLEQWLKDNPADQHARLYLADAYMQRGQDELAVSQYQRAIEQEPRNVLALNNISWLYHKLRRPKAVETAEQAYKLASTNPQVVDNLGWILFEQGKNPRALQLLQEALALAPEDPGIRYHYAAALARSGDKVKARSELERLLGSKKAFPQEKEARELLGRL